jgi:hypothetical protein
MEYPPDIPIEVCDLFVKLAREAKAAHFRRFSADMILHRIRWYFTIEAKRTGFKANNNWTSTLARWAMKAAPDLEGFFETRVLKSQQVKTITQESWHEPTHRDHDF